jgi:thiamine-monophosphate kinase
MTEFDLIRRYFTHPARGATLGVGDDAALLRVAPRNELVVSADMLVEGRHFIKGADPVRLGHKALAVNLSDIAAMGAKPRWATLALALPTIDEKWLAGFSRGFMALARRFSVGLVGGDTTRGPLTLSVQIMGEVPAGKALRRDGAKVGDDVWVSGYLGEAAMALEMIESRGWKRIGNDDRKILEERLHAPTPRVALGLALRGTAHSAIDVSDGLLADLGHICERSGVCATIEWEAVPAIPLVRSHAQTDRGARGLLAGGDDYELCFTASQRRRAAVMAAAARARVRVTMIGRVERKRGRGAPVTVLDSVGHPMKSRVRGYDHFR